MKELSLFCHAALSQAQYDKLKRRALLAPTVGSNQPGINLAGGPELHPGVGVSGMNTVSALPLQTRDNQKIDQVPMAGSFGHQIQRPAAGIVNRTAGQFNTPGGGGLPLPLWSQSLQQHQQQHQQQSQHISPQNAPPPVRQPFVASERSLDTSERSNTAQEVEELLGSQGRMQRRTHYQGGWASTNQAQQQQQQRGKSSNFICLCEPLQGVLELYIHSICPVVGTADVWDV
jgi:hypothetical protein